MARVLGNELSGEDTLPLLARLMASAIVKENDNNMAQFYAESLIDYYVAEYYTPVLHSRKDCRPKRH
jgi:hypothetical protein